MARTKPDNELVTWDCCGNRWEIILTRLQPERDLFQPLCERCGKKLLPALRQHRAQLQAELAREIAILRAFYRTYDWIDTPSPASAFISPGLP